VTDGLTALRETVSKGIERRERCRIMDRRSRESGSPTRERTRSMKSCVAVFLIVCMLAVAGAMPASAQQGSRQGPPEAPLYDRMGGSATSENPDGITVLADAAVLRPLGLAACVVGLVGSLVALPFAASSGSGEVVRKKFLREPFEYTFKRRLGDVD